MAAIIEAVKICIRDQLGGTINSQAYGNTPWQEIQGDCPIQVSVNKYKPAGRQLPHWKRHGIFRKVPRNVCIIYTSTLQILGNFRCFRSLTYIDWFYPQHLDTVLLWSSILGLWLHVFGLGETKAKKWLQRLKRVRKKPAKPRKTPAKHPQILKSRCFR